jgi:SAM-dependent methyltransferase
MAKDTDHFSGHAAEYARSRPTYPLGLYRWLASVTPGRVLAWDAGCGNGQATVALAEHFDHVVGTDISPQQLDEAKKHPKVEYQIGDEGTSHQADGSVDLITAAQSAHWFDLPTFHREARRVLKPKGIVAIWGYGLTRFAPEIDVAVQRFYSDVVGPFWPSGREHLDNEYRSLDLQIEPTDTPAFLMSVNWDLRAFGEYLETWSAVQRYKKAKGEDPVPAIVGELQRMWGPHPRVVSWPLYLRVGRLK